MEFIPSTSTPNTPTRVNLPTPLTKPHFAQFLNPRISSTLRCRSQQSLTMYLYLTLMCLMGWNLLLLVECFSLGRQRVCLEICFCLPEWATFRLNAADGIILPRDGTPVRTEIYTVVTRIPPLFFCLMS